MADLNRLREILKSKDAKLIMALEGAIANVATTAEARSEYREALGSIGGGYANLDLLDDEDWADFCGVNSDRLSDEEWAEFINRPGARR